jgi:hypothetical protein
MRRSIDPLGNTTTAIDRNVLFVPVTDLPTGLPMAAGMKPPKTRWDTYRDVQASLLDKNCTPGSFEQDHKQGGDACRKLRPILKDILVLHDTAQLEFPKLLERNGTRYAEIVEHANKRPHEFPFLRTRSTERLARGALLPVVAAFRWLVETDPASGTVRWRGGFGQVLERWRAASDRLVALTVEKCREVGDNPDALGRSASHWSALHKEVAFLDLLAKPAATAGAPAAQPPSA